MTKLSDNSELFVFVGTVVPSLWLGFRFLLKLQVTGDSIYERRTSIQNETIEDQQQLIHDLKQLEKDCKERDAVAMKRIRELESEVASLRLQIERLG